ncbi:aldo/keto reductase [Dyadobacter sp. CY327]|uniref:aldo/keto reductase n=1 Tax=Dyadobacter sp. CY327 TaxID=2907301 RepID=UPI001F34D1F7|nr:aldo/keto reductase [Dyadobacter sp. CY327]MCE7070856.1 aldo/keto reductase [Dyadobacter sp. CY327]
MKYTAFKAYRFSALTLGTAQLGLPYGVSNQTGIPAPEEANAMLAYATELGINTFDTARTYGYSENVLGGYIEKHEPGQSHVVSKFKISRENLMDQERAWREVSASVMTSLNTLKIPRLPVCLLHKGVEPMEQVMKVLPEILQRLKSEGLIDIGGISAYFPDDIPYFLEDPDVEAAQVPLNIFDQRLIRDGYLDRLHAKGKLVFVRSVFLQGLFFMHPEQLTGVLQKAKDHLRQLKHLAEQGGMSVAQLAFSFVRDLPAVDSIVVGAVNTQQVSENVNLMNGPVIPGEILAGIAEAFLHVDEEVITPGLWKL